MNLGDMLEPDGVIPALTADSKKQALQALADHAAKKLRLNARDVLDAMMQRERLGSTGMGRGIAIPHVKLAGLQSIHCLFARLERPIDFDAIDGEKVDLIFLLLAPEHASGDHLKALARISRLLREPRAIDRLRSAKDRAAIVAVLTAEPTTHAA